MLNSCAVACHRNPASVGSAIPTFSIGTDATLSDWTEATDIQLADTLWKYFQGMFPTSVEQIASLVPAEYRLMQNYPNPFNPSTKVEFYLPKRSPVRIAVYNIVGQQVKIFFDQEMEAGSYRVTWNGKNDYGEYTPSGVYFVRLDAGDFSSTKKMILL